MVGLRSATVSDTTATIWAGAGIVAASDPEAELAETTVKLAVVLEGLAPGASALLEGYAIKY
jgi:isochorismate synthase EntC